MKIFCLTLIKNEVDIAEECLVEALRWADRIAVLDNGSTDGSRELMESLAERYPGRIDFVGMYTGPYSNDLRMLPFQWLRHEAEPGDWWCRLDVDEFYPVDPRAFLSELSSNDCRVNAINLFYEFTDVDLAAWKAARESLADRARPIAERRRYYRSTYQEPRFMRHHPKLVWQGGDTWPRPRGPLASEAILMQHFRARDPEQMKSRLAVRKLAAEKGLRKPDHHWRVDAAAWRTQIVDHRECHYDEHDGRFVVDRSRFELSRGKRFGQSLKRAVMACGWRL